MSRRAGRGGTEAITLRLLRERAVALAAWLGSAEGTLANMELATRLGEAATVEEAAPLLAEARRRGWKEGGLWALPAGHPLRDYGPELVQSVLAESAARTSSGRTRGGRSRGEKVRVAAKARAEALVIRYREHKRRNPRLGEQKIAELEGVDRKTLRRALGKDGGR